MTKKLHFPEPAADQLHTCGSEKYHVSGFHDPRSKKWRPTGRHLQWFDTGPSVAFIGSAYFADVQGDKDDAACRSVDPIRGNLGENQNILNENEQ